MVRVGRFALLMGILLTVLLAGCTEQIKAYERSSASDRDQFVFHIAEGTKRVIIEISTRGGEGGGTMDVVIAADGMNVLYMGGLGAGGHDRAVVDDPAPGRYVAVIDYDDYAGPAQITIEAARAGATIAPVEDFWSILGILITISVAVGGWFLYRQHTRRLDREMARIDETFHRLNKDVVRCRRQLEDMQEELRQRLVRSKLKEAHFLILEKRIDRYLQDLALTPAPNASSAETPLAFD